MKYIELTYTLYIIVSITLTVWVARTLFRSGRAFLNEGFPDNDALAGSINRLLVVGFYLVNLGFIALFLRTSRDLTEVREMFELLSSKLGVVLLTLGFMHFVNLLILNGLRNNAIRQQNAARPPAIPGYEGYRKAKV
ncbi:MAG: hypothetical protein BGO12_22840 [Verrucomicrobia bacterium 61-8]|nr:MAG: hypothetical protein BGO12_22840 [Verrucomicrobia bacterium 61-8]